MQPLHSACVRGCLPRVFRCLSRSVMLILIVKLRYVCKYRHAIIIFTIELRSMKNLHILLKGYVHAYVRVCVCTRVPWDLN